MYGLFHLDIVFKMYGNFLYLRGFLNHCVATINLVDCFHRDVYVYTTTENFTAVCMTLREVYTISNMREAYHTVCMHADFRIT